MPLYIFETRYREMLTDALASDRLFAIAKLSLEEEEDNAIASTECPCRYVTVGVIRLSSENQDGTSNVLLQGLTRARIDEVVQETPYRKIAITPFESESQKDEIDLNSCKSMLRDLIKAKEAFGFNYMKEIKSQIENTQNLDTLADLATFSICADSNQKQQLLETTSPNERFRKLVGFLKHDIAVLQLKRDIDEDYSSEDIGSN